MSSVHHEQYEQYEQLSQSVIICNQRGLHARAAVKLANLASNFTATIEMYRNGMGVSCFSIMGLMMLSATRGSTIEIKASGPDAEAAMTAIVTLINHGFNED